MAQTNWEADKMLDVYIYDYLTKRKLHASAKAFQVEGKVSADPFAIDAPGGFLFEWWSVFWDIFIARTNEKHSEPAASYIETQVIKTRELQQQHQKPQQQQIQMQQQLLMQRHAMQQQQQRTDGVQISNGNANGISGNDSLMRQNPGTANVLATKMYEDRLKISVPRDPLDDAAMKQRFSDNMGQLIDPNHASLLKTGSLGGQPLGQSFHGAHGGMPGNLQQVQNRAQQHQDIKTEINPMMNPRAICPDGGLIGVHGSNQGGNNNLTLKGWPLTGFEPHRPGILQQQQKSLMQSQPLHQLQLQQQFLQEQQNSLTSRMLTNGRNIGLGKDGHLTSVGDVIPNVGSPMQVTSPALPRADTDILTKQPQFLNNNKQQQQYPLSNQQSQNSNNHLQQHDKIDGGSSISMDPNITNTFGGNDQISKAQIGRKRKQTASSSGPANSSGTTNTAGPSPSSAPSTPSTHTVGDVISMPHNANSSKPLLMFGSDGMGTLTSASNPLGDIDPYVDDGSLDDNVESFLAHDDGDTRDVSQHVDVNKSTAFAEVAHFCASTSKIECCHFSSDGKLLATGGLDKKAVLWCTDSQMKKSTLEEHSYGITDVRFSPSIPRLATSSHDRTVRVWDAADNLGYSLRTFMGHSTSVMSLDFHPNQEDLICSCDNNGEIRYWSIKNGSYARVFKGGMSNVRFQPHRGRYLAAAAENTISIFDVETQACRNSLQGPKNVQSLCWDPSGEYVASVSDDLVRVWTIGPGGEGKCIHELSGVGKKFHCCIFHPSYPSVLIIGCYQSLELWDMTMADKKTTILPAHNSQIAGLAVSSNTGLVASVGHDKVVKLWK